ncbi:YceD family protein [Roseovarius pelagicus]|uniref:DUF177 domain-containing protein n=1 Tax=Roseovarius pelagicus TaxID=2980108 RepID=A0ABY6DBA6_9RHOB|nr:DUF177 domain-containing protein [Roseovarius pelagicus]UXX83380.1 DUF177 domain-containing protein [Roseovarius pelagicus]
MTRQSENPEILRIADLPQRGATPFELSPDAGARAALAEALGVEAIRKLSFRGQISPDGRRDWLLDASLGATVVQSCVVTLAPVTTRVDRKVIRRFLAEMPDDADVEEIEMPEDETIEQLTDVVDLSQVMQEALALAIPDYPRADGAELQEAVFAPPDATPLRDEDLKPFAGLADLKSKLEKDD